MPKPVISPPRNVYQHAGALYAKGRMQEAARYTHSMLRQYPEDVHLINLMAGIYAALDNWTNALKLRPGFIEAASSILHEIEHTNDLKALRAALDKMAAQFAGHPIHDLFRGLLLLREKSHSAANKYSAEGVRNRIQSHINYFTPETVAQWSTLEASTETTVFMVGSRDPAPHCWIPFLGGTKISRCWRNSPWFPRWLTPLTSTV